MRKVHEERILKLAPGEQIYIPRKEIPRIIEIRIYINNILVMLRNRPATYGRKFSYSSGISGSTITCIE